MKPLPFKHQNLFLTTQYGPCYRYQSIPRYFKNSLISLLCNALSFFEISTMSGHVHFTAGLYDTLNTKDRLFSWTCPVTPQDDSLSVVIPRFVLPPSHHSHPSPTAVFLCGIMVHSLISFFNYRLFKNLEENHYFLELEHSLLTVGPARRVSAYIDFDNCWYHQRMRHL